MWLSETANQRDLSNMPKMEDGLWVVVITCIWYMYVSARTRHAKTPEIVIHFRYRKKISSTFLAFTLGYVWHAWVISSDCDMWHYFINAQSMYNYPHYVIPSCDTAVMPTHHSVRKVLVCPRFHPISVVSKLQQTLEDMSTRDRGSPAQALHWCWCWVLVPVLTVRDSHRLSDALHEAVMLFNSALIRCLWQNSVGIAMIPPEDLPTKVFLAWFFRTCMSIWYIAMILTTNSHGHFLIVRPGDRPFAVWLPTKTFSCQWWVGNWQFQAGVPCFGNLTAVSHPF